MNYRRCVLLVLVAAAVSLPFTLSACGGPNPDSQDDRSDKKTAAAGKETPAWTQVAPGVLRSPGAVSGYALVDGERALLIDAPVPAAGLEDQHTAFRVGRQAVGHDAAGCPCANHDVVEIAFKPFRHFSVSTRPAFFLP